MSSLHQLVNLPSSRAGEVGLPRLMASGLTFSEPGHSRLTGVSLAVSAGEQVGLVGGMEAGRSTFLNILTGQLRPTFGIFKINETIVRGDGPPPGLVGTAVPEETMEPGLSGREWLARVAWRAGLDEPAAGRWLSRLLWRTGLSAFSLTRLGCYPPGARKLLSLAAASAGSPPVIVLDEPASGLTGPHLAILRRLINTWCAEGSAVLVGAERRDVAALGCHRLYIMESGTVVASGTQHQLYGTDVLPPQHLMPVRVPASGAGGALDVRGMH